MSVESIGGPVRQPVRRPSRRVSDAVVSWRPPVPAGMWRRPGVLAAAGAALLLASVLVVDGTPVRYLVLGLGAGALIAALALGLVLTYTSSGVVNFANGAVALYVGYVYDGLRTEGRLHLPPLPNPLALVEGLAHLLGADGVRLPDIPTSIVLTQGRFRFASALLLALLVAGLLGALIHLVVFRPLRGAPPLARVVAAVGLFVVMQSIITIRFGGDARPVSPILSRTAVRFGTDSSSLVLPAAQLELVALVALAAAVLWALFRFTRFGLATRAAAANEKGAVLLGLSPDRLALTNWVLSTVLAGLFGILAAPLTTLDPIGVPLLVVPALGAALAAGFRSFGVATAVGLGIGGVQSLTTWFGTQPWFPAGVVPAAGLAKAIPFVVIVVVMVLRGRSLPDRATVADGRLPAAAVVTRPGRSLLLPGVVLLVPLLFAGFSVRQAVVNSLVAGVVCLSLVLVTGYVGQISLAQMALAGTAGFALSKLFAGWPLPFGPLAAALVATAAGVVVSLPSLRVRGVSLAVVTLAAAVAVEELVFKNAALAGASGVLPVRSPTLFGFDIGPANTGLRVFGFRGDGRNPNVWFGVLCLAVAVALAVGVANLRRAALGRRMLAVRANERAAAAAGISVARTKVLAFALSAFVAGVGGVLSGYRFGSVTPLYFGAFASLAVAAVAYLGGISSVHGAFAAGLLASGGVAQLVLTDGFHLPAGFVNLASGVGLIVCAIANPDGIAGGVGRLVRRVWTSR